MTCSMSFRHYPDPEKFFLSLEKVLRPGERFILRDMASKRNDIEMASWASYNLTTIQQPIDEMVDEVVNVLSDSLNDKDKSRKIKVIQPQMIIRSSVGINMN